MSIDWNWGIFLQQAPFGNTTYLGWIWSGFQVTIALSICAWIIAFLVGSFFGILRTVPNRFLSGLGTLYVELFRNVPLIVQFFTWYLVIPELLPEKIGMWFKAELDPNIQFFLSSMLCLGLFSGCGSDVYIAKLALSGTAGTFDPQFAENQNSILVASNVFFSILIASLLFHYEKLTVPKITGCILGFAGVVIINLTGAGMDGGLRLTGEGFILFSALAYAFSSVLVKKYSAKEDPVALSGYQFLLGGIVLTACGLAMGGRVHGFTAASTGLLIYMAMISAVAYTLWSILLKFNPVSKVAVFGFMNPVCGVVLSALILNEKNQAFSVQGFAALVLVCIGIYQVNHVPEKG